MTDLFGNPPYPDGFSYHENFLTPEEEEQAIAIVKNIPLHTFIFHGYEAKRKVQSFGYDYNFQNKALTRSNEIPGELEWLIGRVSELTKTPVAAFAELLVTEYPVGSVINWHRDAPPFDMIAGISLQADCVFKLRPYDKKLQHRNAVISIPVRRRSLYVISRESRTAWEHSTAPVNHIRYSITLRTLR